MILKKFEEFVKSRIVKKQNPDEERAKSLLKESKEKLDFFEKVRKKLGKELNSNYVVETCYDILVEILRAKLLVRGFKTDSHEAEVSYMRNLGFSENDVNFMNQLRYFRNGIKYYGRIFEKEYSDKVIKFLYYVLHELK